MLGFCVLMLRRASVIELDEILRAATTAVVKLLLIVHLIEVCARAALAAGFRLVRGNEDW